MESAKENVLKALREFSRDEQVLGELSAYCSSAFEFPKGGRFLPLPDESQLTFWKQTIQENPDKSGFDLLREVFPQFHFPIQTNISQSTAYKSALLKGKKAAHFASAEGLFLNHPGNTRLFIHRSPAGKIPVLEVGDEADFTSIIQALAYKNEPKTVPPSMGAILIKGLTNWQRINAIKEEWKDSADNLPWSLFFKKNVLPHRDLYQDKLIVLSRKPYSGVSHQPLGLSQEEWLDQSFQIRLQHESAHYFTQRYLGGMRIHLHDEVLADYTGIVQTLKRFDRSYFEAFLGIEKENYRQGGRMENYLHPSGLSPKSIALIPVLLRSVAQNLDRYHQFLIQKEKFPEIIPQILSIASLSLAELAGKEGFPKLKKAHHSLAETSASFQKRLAKP